MNNPFNRQRAKNANLSHFYLIKQIVKVKIMGNLFLPIMRMNVHLNQDGSVGKEREENDADHGETPNLQGRQS